MSRQLPKMVLSKQQTLLLSLHQCDLLCSPLTSWLGGVFESHMHHEIVTYEQMGQNSKKKKINVRHRTSLTRSPYVTHSLIIFQQLASTHLLSFSSLLLIAPLPPPLLSIIFDQHPHTPPSNHTHTHSDHTHITSHSYFISHIDQYSLLHSLDHF